MYSQLQGCRVCSHPEDAIVSQINEDIFKGMDIGDILFKYSGKFTEIYKPLNRTCLFAHAKHIRRSIPAQILQISDVGSSNSTHIEPASKERSESFDAFVGTVEKDKQLVEMLANSAVEDLVNSDILLASSLNIEESVSTMALRNQLRKALGEIIRLSKEITTPVIALEIGDTNKKLFVEFLLIVKKAAEISIENQDVKDAFLLEITSQLRKSREFKSILEEEKDRREIMDKVDRSAKE